MGGKNKGNRVAAHEIMKEYIHVIILTWMDTLLGEATLSFPLLPPV